MADAPTPWWERWDGRLDHELAALASAGVPSQVDEEAKAAGILKIDATVDVDGEQIAVRAIFPDSYPYFRFEVYAPELDLEHHQNPVSKNLCLINRGTENWDVDDTLAAFLIDRLPEAVRTGRTVDRSSTAGREAAQPEPRSSYLAYAPGAAVIVDGSWTFDDTSGMMTIGLDDSPTGFVHGTVLTVHGHDGQELVRREDHVVGRYAQTLNARWVSLDSWPDDLDAQVLSAEAIVALGQQLTWNRAPWLGDGKRIGVLGVRLPDEVRWRELGTTWVFIVHVASAKAIAKARRPGGELQTQLYLAPGMRGGRRDLAERIPRLAPLAESTILVVGAGGIGAPASLEFIRGGAKRVRIVDFDVAEPGPSVRWPLGVIVAGAPKVEAIAEFAALHHPHVIVEPILHRIGAVRTDPHAVPEDDVINNLLENVDLVFDASAEPGVQYFLSERSRRRGIPYVAAWTVPGASGAVIVRIRPDGGCWMCLQSAVAAGEFTMPAAADDGTIALTGCADLSFTGTGFDVTASALHGVRMAMSTLCADDYASSEWDVGCFQFFDEGSHAPRTLEMWALDPRPSCPACATASDDASPAR